MSRLNAISRRPAIAPSILSADFGFMAEDCRGVLAAGGDLLHVDVMDGHFVPNLTMGPDMCRGLRKAIPDVCLDVHLMVEDPAKFVAPFAKAGADVFTFHIERLQGAAARELAKAVRDAGMSPGIAVNPPTKVDALLEVMDAFDLMLVMSVNPGYSGQAFIPEVLSKARAIAARRRPEQWIEIDGGVNPQNAASVREAGVDLIVAASAIFGLPAAQRGTAITRLRG